MKKEKLWYYILSDSGKTQKPFLTKSKIDKTKDDYTHPTTCIFWPMNDPGQLRDKTLISFFERLVFGSFKCIFSFLPPADIYVQILHYISHLDHTLLMKMYIQNDEFLTQEAIFTKFLEFHNSGTVRN